MCQVNIFKNLENMILNKSIAFIFIIIVLFAFYAKMKAKWEMEGFTPSLFLGFLLIGILSFLIFLFMKGGIDVKTARRKKKKDKQVQHHKE